MKTAAQMVAEARECIHEVSVDGFQALQAAGDPLVIDVREAEEVAQGMIPGAQWVPRGFLELKIEALESERQRPIMIYCAGGVRSALAARTLVEMGYGAVHSLQGGFKAWSAAGHPTRQP